MAKFKPGDKKPEGSGRKPGQLNKKSIVLLEIFEAADYCPAVEILKLINSPSCELNDKEKIDVHAKLMEYKFPKRKAIEHSGSVENVNKRYEDYINEIENGESNGDS